MSAPELQADAAEVVPEPPEGFVPSSRRGPFSRRNGPFFERREPGRTVHAFYALERHCNGFGIVHGGMLASFIDGLFGHAVAAAANRPAVTLQLSLDYLSMARAGDWIIGEAKVTRLTREVAFAEAQARVGDKDVVRAHAIFKLMERRPDRG